MTDYIEIEARWLDLNPEETRTKLAKAGAIKTGEFFYKEWIFQHDDWMDHVGRRRIRIRTDGRTTWLTYKANATWKVDSTEEVELTVSSAEAMAKFLEAVDLPKRRYQEKKMERYKLDNTLFEINFWPKIPMVFEIEAPSEKEVREGAELLGLKWEDAIFEDQKMVHEKFYNVDLDVETDYKFDDTQQ